METCSRRGLPTFLPWWKFIFVGKVVFKYPFLEVEEQVEVGSRLAESVWGRDVDGRTWPYLIFLSDVREIDLPLSKFNELTGYRFSAIGGFMRVREAKVGKIIDYLSGALRRAYALLVKFI